MAENPERPTIEGARLLDDEVQSIRFAVEHLRDRVLPLLDDNHRAQVFVSQACGVLRYVLDRYAPPATPAGADLLLGAQRSIDAAGYVLCHCGEMLKTQESIAAHRALRCVASDGVLSPAQTALAREAFDGAMGGRTDMDTGERGFRVWLRLFGLTPSPSNVGRAPSDAAERDPQGDSRP